MSPTVINWELPIGLKIHLIEFEFLEDGMIEVRRDGRCQYIKPLAAGTNTTDQFRFSGCVANVHTVWNGKQSTYYMTIRATILGQEEEMTFKEYKRLHLDQYDTWFPVINGISRKLILDTNSLVLYDENGQGVEQMRNFCDTKDGVISIFWFHGKKFRLEVTQQTLRRVFKVAHTLYCFDDSNETPREKTYIHNGIYHRN